MVSLLGPCGVPHLHDNTHLNEVMPSREKSAPEPLRGSQAGQTRGEAPFSSPWRLLGTQPSQGPGSLCPCPPGLMKEPLPGGQETDEGERAEVAVAAPLGDKHMVGDGGAKSPHPPLGAPALGHHAPPARVSGSSPLDTGPACKSGQAAGPGTQPVFRDHRRRGTPDLGPQLRDPLPNKP